MKRGEPDHLDAYLEGDLDLRELPHEVRGEEDRIRELLDRLRIEDPAPEGLRQEVMDAVRALPGSRWEGVIGWFLRPRTIRLSPATAGVVALALVVALVLVPGRGLGPVPDRPATAAEGVVTRFVLVAPEATRVAVTGDWLGWDPRGTPMEEVRGTGVWATEVPVPPGVHEYSFVIDGTEWRPDPLAGPQVDDGFGQTNSLIMVSASEA